MTDHDVPCARTCKPHFGGKRKQSSQLQISLPTNMCRIGTNTPSAEQPTFDLWKGTLTASYTQNTYVTLCPHTQKRTFKLETWDIPGSNSSCLKEIACPGHMTNAHIFSLRLQILKKYNKGPMQSQLKPRFRQDWTAASCKMQKKRLQTQTVAQSNSKVSTYNSVQVSGVGVKRGPPRV